MLIEKEGKFFQADDKGEVVKNDKGEPIPATEDEIKSHQKEQKGKTVDVDIEKADLTELAKVNPNVAKFLTEHKSMLDEKSKAETEAKTKEQEEAQKRGEWQKLYESEKSEREKTKAEHDKLYAIVGEYKKTVEEILDSYMKVVPKEKQTLIPSDYTPKKKLEYIINNAKLLGLESIVVKGGKIPPSEMQTPATDEAKLADEVNTLLAKTNRTYQENSALFEKSKKLKEMRATKEIKK